MELRASLLMFACLQWCLIGASGGFDHYPTGRDLVILGLPLAVQLGGEMLVVRMGHGLWADGGGPIRGNQGRVSHRHLPTSSADGQGGGGPHACNRCPAAFARSGTGARINWPWAGPRGHAGTASPTSPGFWRLPQSC